MYRDYAPKGVRLFFIYKSLAHPELQGNYVQPFTDDERRAHARQAIAQLGASIPWLVDPIDNRLKHALGNRANSEFVIDPEGKIVRKRAWSDPAALRKDLEELVGRVERITPADDVKLNLKPPLVAAAATGTVDRLPRAGMFPLASRPQSPDETVFYAKLRAEADLDMIDTGRGRLYVSFHLDPFHAAHWNNLTEPLRFTIEAPETVELSQRTGEAPLGSAESDADPREFMLDVANWPEDVALRLTVTYAACVDQSCHRIRQAYVLRRQHDRDAGNALVAGFRGLTRDQMVELLMAKDKNGDRKLVRDELNSLLRQRFKDYDLNADDALDHEEIQRLAEQATKPVD